MSDTLSIALAQIDPVVGDVAGNVALIRAARARAAADRADLIVYPELVVSGYPPEDLVLKAAFLDAVEAAVDSLAKDTADGGPAMLVGAPWRMDGLARNAALLLDHGKVTACRLKRHLPNYGVFDEARVFVPGPLPAPITFRGVRLGVPICEDMWYPDVAETLAAAGAEILVVPNGSPFEVDKSGVRLERAAQRVAETGLPLVYVNQLGGQDELVFDGASFALGGDGRPLLRLAPWRAEVLTTVWRRTETGWTTEGKLAPEPAREESIYQAMVWGLRDYVGKNGFPGVVLGLSGGIDSALAAAVAADALGPDKVWCVMMPSPYTSQDSLDDAAGVARLLGCRLDTIGIRAAMTAFDGMLGPLFVGREPDITEENLQSRARGLTLMALSNKFGPMVLSTGNKSELSTGYATLYGDMCGGYAVLKDVYKTAVFAVCRWRNAHVPAGALGPNGPVMPERVITKPPSAELKPDQTDQDTLPPYDELDGILMSLIEGELSVADTVAKGYDEATVRRVWRMLDRAEYKRRQAPPGVKITGRSFGKDRRYPITNGFTKSV
ncbi:NAD+ synthase [Magnetospirillum sp. UT-4]|uniref:NAD+ synthase n=1 Tax=Magnetospirillum sp. UT-4 TaxID=2681467 RepID=UPI00137C3F9A|nr:NAD+ synthase [Magnetospirillum sp. UT-4]CAA7614137.1 Glutamine-dependent NAD(+) synthetase [Magnetospirillum sp. UT-4]